MWSSHVQRFREWRHPLRQSLPEREESILERLIDCWMMHERLWEYPILSTNKGGHQRGTLDIWHLWVHVL